MLELACWGAECMGAECIDAVWACKSVVPRSACECASDGAVCSAVGC